MLRTDTIYGLVGSALNPKTVERIYKLRERRSNKPMIILISSLNSLASFKIRPNGALKKFLIKIWPAKVSVILPCPSDEFYYLHRGAKTLAFRIPQKLDLIKLLEETGPLVAPSANPKGLEPAKTIKEAKKYFGDRVDFYLDEGQAGSNPSTLVALEDGRIVIKRSGAVDISSLLE